MQDFEDIMLQNLYNSLYPSLKTNIGVGFWRNKNGEILKVEDISDRYLENISNFLKKSDFVDKDIHIKYIERELEERMKIRCGWYI